ncbi:MAG: hypothetical protein JWP74_4155 [Marmoricola sp.]|nr:hypothetical protein [Marmoricola sp.]
MSPPTDPAKLWDVAFGAVRQITGAFVDGLTGAPPSPSKHDGVPAAPTRTTGLDTKMRALLTRALEQSTVSGQTELFHRILDQLVPDEARILGALSDGSASPMVSVHALNRAGLLGEALIENASLVGRTANVALPQLTPTYVGHLISLGLLEPGAEDEHLKDDYQILMADTDVLAAIRRGSLGPVPARVEKRTVRLSTLGHSLWTASMGDDSGAGTEA